MARRADAICVAMIRGELSVLRVVEGRPRPCARVVAGRASGREELRLCRVARIRRVVVVGLMATDAGSRQCCVIVVDVAVGTHARGHGVRAG